MLSRPALGLASRYYLSWHSRAISASSIPSTSRSVSENRNGGNQDSICIKTWENMGSLADVYAVVRAVERKYGRILEFRVRRDSERPELLTPLIWAIFRSSQSWHLVPQDGDVLHVTLPSIDRNVPGGIGLDALEGLLVPQERSEDGELPKWRSVMTRLLEEEEEEEEEVKGDKRRRVLDVKVERSVTNLLFRATTETFNFPSNDRLRAIGHSFLDWGGFHPLHPLSSPPASSSSPSPTRSPNRGTSHIPPPVIPLPPDVDHRRMRMVLTKWSRFVGRPDPSVPVEVEPETTPVAGPSSEETSAEPHVLDQEESLDDLEWEPIPDVAPQTDNPTDGRNTPTLGEIQGHIKRQETSSTSD